MGADGDGAALLIERGRAANPRLTIEKESARAISRELDGIPLSLEVAAVRLAVLTPQQLLAGLAERSWSAVGGAGSPGRRPTLEDALDWSVDSLPRLPREAYARLGVFRGGFDLDGAAAVLGSALDDVVVQLAVLTGHSLLTTRPSGGVMRYRMLEPVRQHSWKRLVDLSTVDTVAQAHADYFSALAARAAPRLRGRDQLLWLSRLDDEHDNIMEALDHLIGSGRIEPALNLVGNVSWYWFLRSRLGEGWYWLERVIDAAGDAEGVPLARALIAAGQFAWEQAANDQARAWLERASEMAARCTSPSHVAWAAVYLAQLDLMEGDHESARVRAEEAINTFAGRGNTFGVGFGAWVAAMAAVSPGLRAGTLTPSEKGSAIETLTPLARIAEEIGDLNLRGHLSWSLGMVESVGGDPDTAERHLLDGVRRFAELGNHSCLCHVLDAMAMVMADSGRLYESARLVGMVEGLRERVGNPGHLTERELRARCLRRLSEKLDADSLVRLTAEGRTFASPEQAIAVVLDAAGRTVPGE
jgi:non-specific serine/threonine protein kinase